MLLDHLEPDDLRLTHTIDLVVSGEIAYSKDNKRKVLGSLRKMPRIYEKPASEIKADPTAFRKLWGSGAVTSYPLGYFSSEKAYQVWRSNCFSTFVRAQELMRPTPETSEVEGWNEMLELFDIILARSRPGTWHPKQMRISLERVRMIGVEAGLSPWELTQQLLIDVRHAATPGKARTTITRAAAAFERLRGDADFEKFMPDTPVAPLPSLRVLDSSDYDRLPARVKKQWQAYVEEGAQKRAPLSGTTIQLSDGYLGAQEAAFRWYVRMGARLKVLDPAHVRNLKELCRPEILAAIVQHNVAQKTAGEKHLMDESMRGYLGTMRRLFSYYGVTIQDTQNEPLFSQSDDLSEKALTFCKAILRDRKIRRLFFAAPDLLKARAERALAQEQWAKATRYGSAALSVAILTRVAPLRRANASQARLYGENPNLKFDQRGRLESLQFGADEMKAKKSLEVPIDPGKAKDYVNGFLAWYLEKIRPLSLTCTGSDGRESDFLFPSPKKTGHAISRQTWADWLIESLSEIGLPMTPHLVRHGAATLILDRKPEYLGMVAALLGNKPATVLRHYAFIDKLDRIRKAQGTVGDIIDDLGL